MKWLPKIKLSWKGEEIRLPKNVVESLYNFIGFMTPIVFEDNFEEYIKNGYQLNVDVYAVIQLHIRLSSGIPYKLYKISNKEKFRKVKSSKLGIKAMQVTGEMEEITDHPLLKLLDTPNPLQTKEQLFESLRGFLLLTGNSYLLKSRAETSKDKLPKQLYVLPAQYVEIESGDAMNPVSKYVVNINMPTAKVDAQDVIHLKYWNPDYSGNQAQHLYGQAPLLAARNVVQSGNDSVLAQMKMLQSMGAIGIISGEKESDYSEEQLKQVQDKYMKFVGSDKIRKPIISSSPLKWQSMTYEFDKLGVTQTSELSRNQICRIFGIDPGMIGDKSASTYNNVKEMRKGAYIDAIIPLLDRERDALQKGLVKEYGDDLYIDYDLADVPEMQQELKELREAYGDIWQLTPNQRLKMMGLPENEDNPLMNQIWIPTGLMPMDFISSPNNQLDELVKQLEYAVSKKEKPMGDN